MKKLTALGAFFAVALGTAGCGSSIPGNSVASVSGNPITLAAFNHWSLVYAKDQASSEGVSSVIVPTDPPNFEGCIKDARKLYPTLKKTSDKTLKVECAQLFSTYRSAVMQFLIEGYWYQAQAYKQGYRITDAQVQTQMEKDLKKSFPTDTDAKASAYLSSVGETLADFKFQVRASLAYSKLLKAAAKPVTQADIAAYYAKNKSSFGTAASANLYLIRTKTEAKANAAVAALKSGTSWAQVADQYAEDASSRKAGGKLTDVTSSSQETAVSSAIFKSPLNKVVGPIHGEFGYYVIEVTKQTAAVQKSLADSTAEIKELLNQQASSAAATAVSNVAKKNWQSKTNCRALWSISLCHNYSSSAATPSSWSTTSLQSTTSSTSTTATSTAPTGTATGTATSSTQTATATGSTQTGTATSSTQTATATLTKTTN